MQVVLDVLGILAIIAFGAFIIVLVADLLLSIFDKHEGVFFNKGKKRKAKKEAKIKKNEEVVYTGENSGKEVKEEIKEETAEEKVLTTSEVLGIKSKPVIEEKSEDENIITAVDMQKAEEEEKLLRQKFAEVNSVDQFDKVKEEIINSETIKKEEDLKEVLPRILEEALNDGDGRELIRETIFEDLKDPEPANVRIVKEESKINLEDIKADVFRMKKDIKLNKENKIAEVEDDEDEEYIQTTTRRMKRIDDTVKVDINELKKQKLAFATEKMALLQRQADQTQKNKQLEQEKAELEEQIQLLKTEILEKPKKPYYSQKYYEERLVKLEADLKEFSKELRLNKRDFIPLKRVQKAYEKDSVKLRRKEAIVAKQKISLYGAGSSSKVDKEKKAKLDAEMKELNELKDSVYNCEQVLNKNKDRYPILEKANKILTQSVAKAEDEIAEVKTALKWYIENK